MSDIEELLEELGTQLAQNFFQTVQVMSRIVSFTEKYYDGSHSRFVSDRSAFIAKELGMSEEEITEIKIAGLLHDIGKVGFPETLLYKYATEMTQQEYSQYIKHPILGFNILKPHSAFDNIGTIILHHHEKLDGSGFPSHLQREQIHPGAKIIVVVDYFHNAMYKRQRVRTEGNSTPANIAAAATFLESSRDRFSSTMNYIHRKAGALFEPKVVKIFTDLMDFERKQLGSRTLMKIAVNGLEAGMIIAEDYFTSYGMLIASKGETITKEMITALGRFAENGEIPYKILVMK